MNITDKLITIAENEQKVYDAGYEKGKAEGGDSWYDTFWDNYQNNGNKKKYAYGFYSWNRDLFYPKHDIICGSNMAALFQFFESGSSESFDLSARLKERGVTLDTSGATTGGGYCFYWTSFSKIPPVDFTGMERDDEKLTYAFANNYHLTEIEKITCKETNVFNVSFVGCSKLEKLEIEGTIGSLFDISQAPLNKASIESVVEHLSDNVGNTLQLKKSAVINAFGSVDSSEWIKLITPKSNNYDGLWTITLND